MEEELRFSGVVNGEVEGKIVRKANKASLGAFKGNATLPTQKVYQPKVSRHLLPRFLSSSKAFLKEEEDLLYTWTKQESIQMHTSL